MYALIMENTVMITDNINAARNYHFTTAKHYCQKLGLFKRMKASKGFID